jgi:hypothetical protein
MKKYGLPIAIALLVLINIMVFANVLRNRSGEPDAVVELTQRELPFNSYQVANRKENTGVSLRVSWNQYPYYGKYFRGQNGSTQFDWFDKTKLEEIGFDCTEPLTDTDAAMHYGKLLPRKAYVVLEYEGKTWDERIDRERLSLSEVAERVKKGTAADKDLKEAGEEYERVLNTQSRLFAVDAGKDPAKLRLRYPDRSHFIIMAAKVRLHYKLPYGNETAKKDMAKLEGSVEEILVNEIHVPKPMSTVLEKIVSTTGHHVSSVYPYAGVNKGGPAYRVTLHYGNRYEPWVDGVKPIAP